jgi:hypothetical protein
VDVLAHELTHQVVLGALLPPSQAPQLLPGTLRPGDVGARLPMFSKFLFYFIFLVNNTRSEVLTTVYHPSEDSLRYCSISGNYPSRSKQDCCGVERGRIRTLDNCIAAWCVTFMLLILLLSILLKV